MRKLALGGTLVALALAAAQPAAAAGVETDCANLATTLATATEGETIVLSGACMSPTNSFVLPKVAGLTIEGTPSGGSGFIGVGAGGPALFSPPEGTDGLTLRNLSFEDYEGPGAVRIKSTKTATHPFGFVRDRFQHNENATGNGGGLAMIVEEPKPAVCAFTGPGAPVTVTESTFLGNTARFQAGGGAFIDLECAAGGISASVTGNLFADNKVAGDNEPAQGGGLWVGVGHAFAPAIPFALSQQGNALEANVVENTGTEPINVQGGGEFTDGGGVTSLNDLFVANRISGAVGSERPSEGGGLASLDPGECTSTPGASSTLINLIAAGNSIGPPSGTGEGGEGGGVYVGCAPGKGGYHLTLVNSTISANTATGTGAAAGLDGETNDTALLENTIVAGNLGSADLGGFGASAGENVAATFSDVCAVGSASTPLAGAGNICAFPALVGPATGDVHESPASPTIDAGSNAFIGAQPTDAFGGPRILAGRAGDTPTVDIGAAESPAAAPIGPIFKPLPPVPLTAGTAKASHLKSFPGGVSVTIACTGQPGQTCSGSVVVRTVETLRGKRLIAVSSRKPRRHKVTVTVGSAGFSGLKAGSSRTLRIALNAKGRALLKRFRPLPVKVLVSQQTAGKTAVVATARLRVPRRRPAHHHQRPRGG
jgi:hypothetical protein